MDKRKLQLEYLANSSRCSLAFSGKIITLDGETINTSSSMTDVSNPQGCKINVIHTGQTQYALKFME